MKTVFAAVSLIWAAVSADAQQFSASDLTRRIVERRAVEAVIWGMPAVNYDLMLQEMLRLGGKANQIVYWSRLPDWKNQTLTPNPDAIYLMPFINTKDVGPVVIEIPPADEGSITGTIMDAWQMPLADVGPAGMDAGKGGKYVVLPPNFTDKAPDGYIALPSATYQGYALLRSILKSGSESDIFWAVDYGKRIKVYPYRRQQILQRRPSSMRSTPFTTRPFPMTSVSSNRWTALCSRSPGSHATKR
jgi:hypothetical protein